MDSYSEYIWRGVEHKRWYDLLFEIFVFVHLLNGNNPIFTGASGLVWAVLCKGTAAARTGIRSDNLIGDRWVEIIPPGDNLRIVQVSVGTNAVWCVTNDNHVWFRRGIKGGISGISEEAAIGNCWIEMVGNIAQVSVAPNDQVFAIGSENDKYVTRLYHLCPFYCPILPIPF